MSTYKLIYFNITGLGEPLRFLLHQSGIKYEDQMIVFEEWPQIKLNTPLGQLPVLEIDGRPYVQPKAIGRLIAKRNGLYGRNDVEAYEIDVIIDFIDDLRSVISCYHWAEEDEVRKYWKTEINTKLPYTLEKLDEQIKMNRGFFVAGRLSWADLLVSAYLELFSNILGMKVDQYYPELRRLNDRVRSLPRIKAYLDTRPKLVY